MTSICKKIARWIAPLIFIIRIICFARSGRGDVPHRYSQNRTYEKPDPIMYGSAMYDGTYTDHFRGAISSGKSQTKKLGFGKKAHITLSLIPSNTGFAIRWKQARTFKKILLMHERVRHTAKRLKVFVHAVPRFSNTASPFRHKSTLIREQIRLKFLKILLYNARTYYTEYLNRLGSGLWQSVIKRIEESSLPIVFAWAGRLGHGVTRRIKSSRLATPIIPPVKSKNKFVEMLVLQKAWEQMVPRGIQKTELNHTPYNKSGKHTNRTRTCQFSRIGTQIVLLYATRTPESIVFDAIDHMVSRFYTKMLSVRNKIMPLPDHLVIYASLITVIECMYAICVYFFLSSQA